MARLGQDVSGSEGMRDIEPIPAGTYLAHIIESDVLPTKAGDGERLNLTFEILDGPYAHRRVFEGQNIVNKNPTAQTIAQQFLKSLCDAIGHSGAVDDSEELHHHPMMIRVAVEQKDANYPPKNVVKAIKAAGGPSAPAGKPQPAASATPPTAPRQAAPAAAGTKPWQRGRAA